MRCRHVTDSRVPSQRASGFRGGGIFISSARSARFFFIMGGLLMLSISFRFPCIIAAVVAGFAVFAPAGSAQATERRINTVTAGAQNLPAIARLKDGNYIVV